MQTLHLSPACQLPWALKSMSTYHELFSHISQRPLNKAPNWWPVLQDEWHRAHRQSTHSSYWSHLSHCFLTLPPQNHHLASEQATGLPHGFQSFFNLFTASLNGVLQSPPVWPTTSLASHALNQYLPPTRHKAPVYAFALAWNVLVFCLPGVNVFSSSWSLQRLFLHQISPRPHWGIPSPL